MISKRNQTSLCAGLDNGHGVIEQAQTVQAPQALRFQTQEALDHGAFGIPSMLIDSELLFGYEDFIFRKSYLEGKDPMDRTTPGLWEEGKIEPSASR